MLDENLPAFFLKPSASGIKHHRDIYLSHHGSDPSPFYTLQSPDPASQNLSHKNVYATALFDAYNPDVLYGESLARPIWTQPTLNQDEIRRNGGVPPPPQPQLPRELVIQLYNPEQQVKIEVKEGKWGSSDTYEFCMPAQTFRTPSASNLDRGTSDPASLAFTPKINFVWRRESKLGKDLVCYMVGRSSDVETKKKSKKDPDIAVALWRSLRELTLYESNMSRLELEDPKGLEVVLLLGAVGLRDLWMNGGKETLGTVFNINDSGVSRKLSGGGRKLSNPPPSGPMMSGAIQSSSGAYPPHLQTGPPPPQPGPRPSLQQQRPSQPPPLPDPRAQWELDAETARLKAEASAEAKAESRRKKERAKADEAERRRLLKVVEEEQKAAKKKQAEIDRETERLRRMYGTQGQVQQRPSSAQPIMNGGAPPIPQGRPIQQQHYYPPQQPPRASNGMYLQPPQQIPGAANLSTLSFMESGGQRVPGKKKSSFFGGLMGSEGSGSGSGSGDGRLRKKGSAMW